MSFHSLLAPLQELVKRTFASCGDPLVQKQLGYLLARQGESCAVTPYTLLHFRLWSSVIFSPDAGGREMC